MEGPEIEIPAELVSLFGEPPLLVGEDPALYWAIFTKLADDCEPQTIMDWIGVWDRTNFLWEEQRWRRVSVGLISGEMVKALEYHLVGKSMQMCGKLAKKYFSKSAKEREEVNSLLNQYGLTPAVLHAKAAQLNMSALQMCERMISARVNWRRRLDEEAAPPARRQRKSDPDEKMKD